VPIGVFREKLSDGPAPRDGLAEFPTISWESEPTGSAEPSGEPVRCAGKALRAKERAMLAKILGAIAGEKIAGHNRKLTGALIGAAVPVVARRGLAPLAVVLAAGWGVKKLLERRRARTGQSV
jgi:hypothetical protein